MQSKPIRILMWSGPRNISTAMMRSFGNRTDTVVSDEPLYAYYLHETGLQHPGYQEVIASQETDWRKVVKTLSGDVPEGKSIWYQKHMAHHLLPSVERDWLTDEGTLNAFLIREPKEMLTSLINVLGEIELYQTAMPQQLEIFRHVVSSGQPPIVVDARDVLESPREILSELCQRLEIPFSERMLQWSPGPRPTDGVWAKYWYANVYKTTAFGKYRPKGDVVPDRYASILEQCQTIYDEMAEHRIRI